MSISSQITLLLNDQVTTVQVPKGLVALDFLRKHRQLTGSKEGCKEGDCGACTVIVGTLKDSEVSYEPMTSCLLPMGELHGKHLVSIEGLNMEQLSPIQKAMVDCGGTQCGYCTPGFVVAMTAGLMDETVPLNQEGCKFSISGNLCRCTGYRSIKQAGVQAINELTPMLEGKARVAALCDAGALPEFFRNAKEQLASIASQEPKTDSKLHFPFVGGGTDLFVQKGEELPEQEISLLNDSPIHPAQIRDDIIRVDARMSFERFSRDETIQAAIPCIQEYSDQIASWPIRTRATLAGNICNASPIADITCLLLALDAQLVVSEGRNQRTIPLKSFYLGYKKLAKRTDEIVTQIHFPKPTPSTHINWEKVSKRRVLDIATVNSAIRLVVTDSTITEAHLAVGGVSPTPLYLTATSAYLSGKVISLENVLAAIDMAQEEFAPISDVRGTAEYKRLAARQLMLAHFMKLFPEQIEKEDLHATLR